MTWRAHRQLSTAKSTTEAEYYSASEAASELLWIKELLLDAQLIPADDTYLQGDPASLNTSRLSVDSQGAISLARSDVLSRRSRHIEVRHHVLRDWVSKNAIQLKYTPSEDNIAEGFTKPLPIP